MRQYARYVGAQNEELVLIKIIKVIQSDYTLSMLNPKDGYSTDVIRSKLTRDVAVTFKDVREELVMAMDDLILACEDSTWQCS